MTGTFALLADVVGSSGDSPTWLSWVRVVIGATLVVYGVRQWIARGASDQLPGWTGSIQDATPAKGVRLALLLSVANPKVVLLAAAAGLDIGAAKATAAGVVLTAVLFTMVASISVAVPVLTYAVVGDRVLPPMEKAKDWLTRNKRGRHGRCDHRHRPGAAQERPERALTLSGQCSRATSPSTFCTERSRR